ncbi:SUMF1/EgtB/PvdO family nonheme iron enzyme [Ktedonospora formicarum]|uniref:SUMF1/EgtB/PvdO family nonheme iron enzyme n=1 Tax=Ktedonospora formicarum TaxID=2778364 RepID=UPI001C68911E|nr:SUMF1/EgtB/PvdO family nonheme iron enzyme [Ktedonospora formicarum]
MLITSSDHTESHFGTGFVIYNDERHTYLVTCAHVIREVGGPEKVEISGMQAKVIALGPEDGADIAVVRIERHFARETLPLYETSAIGKPFRTAGFQSDGRQHLIRELHGQLGEQVGIQQRRQQERIKAWDLEVTDKFTLQPGYSGSPVVNEDDHVIGIVNTRRGEGKTGVAISVEALRSIWQEMPASLFKQDNKHRRFQKVPATFPYLVQGNIHRPPLLLKSRPHNDSFAAMTSVFFQRVNKSSPFSIQQPQNRTVDTILSEWLATAQSENPLLFFFDFTADIAFALSEIAKQLPESLWIDGSSFYDRALATWKEHEEHALQIEDWPTTMFLVDFSSLTLTHIAEQLSTPSSDAEPTPLIKKLSTFLRWAKSKQHHVVVAIPKYILTDTDFVILQQQTDALFLPERLFAAAYAERVTLCEQLLNSPLHFPDILHPLVSANSSTLPIVIAHYFRDVARIRVAPEKDEQKAIAILLDLAHYLMRDGFYEIAFRIEQYCVTRKVIQQSIHLHVDIFLYADNEKDRMVGSLPTAADLPFVLQHGALTGDTGSGKTTALHQIEHHWALPRLETMGKSIDTYLPIYVPLLPASPFDLQQQIERALSSDLFTRIDVGPKRYPLECHTLVAGLKSFFAFQKIFSSPLLLLLDNADVLTVLDQAQLQDDIDKLGTSSRQIDILVAFREGAMTPLRHRHSAQLQPLDEDQVNEFLAKRRGDKKIHSLLYQIARPISSYIRNPLLLGMICDLGLAFNDMYTVSLHDLLERYVHRARSQLQPGYAQRIIDEWLPDIARHDLLESWSAQVAKVRNVPELILLASKVGLLANNAGNGNVLAFQFVYLRDYFLARYIAHDIQQRGVEPSLTAFFHDMQRCSLPPFRWETVFKILIKQLQKKDVSAFIDFLSLSMQAPQLAQRCLLELGPDMFGLPRRPASALVQSIEDWNIPLEKRIEAAHVLGNLDPRIPDIGRLLSALVKIEPSEFMPGFGIAKYPVTNKEFARFLQDQGYQTKAYWTERGWDWLQRTKTLYPRYWGHGQLNRPNYPVVGVNFFEAKAYCMWLSQCLGVQCDLPSVTQWDRAAHGSERSFELLLALYRETLRKGSVPDKHVIQRQIAQQNAKKVASMQRHKAAEIVEEQKELDSQVESLLINELISIADKALKDYQGQIGSMLPIPIGMHPSNSIGCHDFYGNVWEWTNTVFSHVANYVENVLTTTAVYPGESAFVKGGAPGVANSAIWTLLGGWFDPFVRFHKLGFRIVSVANSERLIHG